VNRPSLAISTVFKPTSFINGIAKDANTSSAYKINEFSYKTEEEPKNRSEQLIVINTIWYLMQTGVDLRLQLLI
jgi:hypothetical protein